MFNGLNLTNKGKELLTHLINDHHVEFTKIKMGDGNKPSDISNLENLVNTKQELKINIKSIIDNETVLIGSNLKGEDVNEAFYWKEVGLFAKDLDGDNIEYLFSYDNAGDTASYIPKGGAVAEQLINLNIVVGNADNVVVNINESLTLVTKKELNDKSSEIITTIDSKHEDNKTKIESHINNKDNPHEVTKNQIGLGNVANLKLATDIEAKNGTSDNAYVTPKNIKQAMEGFGIISDGNLIIKISDTKPATETGKTIIWIDTSN